VSEQRPAEIGERALDISRRYWALDTLPGGAASQLLEDWDAFRTTILAFMERFDVIVCPAAPSPALPHGEGLQHLFDYTLPFSLTGQPSVVVRGGDDADGLPIGVQVVGPVWREEIAVAAALVIERASGGWRPPPVARDAAVS
jgi:amidase